MSRPTPPLLFGAIADDLTGGTELASMLVARGIATGCTVGTDAPIQAGNGAHVILLKTRVIPAADAVAQVLRAAEKLLDAGARQIFFKYCATFDSTPAGNIGPCAEAIHAERSPHRETNGSRLSPCTQHRVELVLERDAVGQE